MIGQLRVCLQNRPRGCILRVAVGVNWGKFSQAVHLGWTARGVSGNVPNLITLLWDMDSRGPVVGFDRAVGFRVERKRSLMIAVGGKIEV